MWCLSRQISLLGYGRLRNVALPNQHEGNFILFSRFFLFLSDIHKVLITLILLTFVLAFVEIDTNNNSHLQNVIAHGFL
jgi:hypothetical protein